jgi:hypothetical protein
MCSVCKCRSALYLILSRRKKEWKKVAKEKLLYHVYACPSCRTGKMLTIPPLMQMVRLDGQMAQTTGGKSSKPVVFLNANYCTHKLLPITFQKTEINLF